MPFLLSEIRDAEVSRAFGVLQRGYSDGQVGLRQFGVGWFSDHTTCWFQMMSGFPANSVFIVDSEDRVRHQTVLDPRFYDFL